MEKILKSKKRYNSTKRNNRKRFCKSLETLFDLVAKKAEQQISGDCLRTKKAKEDVASLHDQRKNAHKMQISTLNHESREKWQRKCQSVKTEHLKITQAFSSKTDKPTTNPIYLQNSFFQFVCKTPTLD